jgi:hypothetical protein
MKTLMALVLVVSGIPLFGMAKYSVADEVVLCLSKENRYIVLSDSSGKCFDGESEIKISSGDINNNGKLVPLANFVSSASCENGAQGSKVEIGFDLNGNGGSTRERLGQLPKPAYPDRRRTKRIT